MPAEYELLRPGLVLFTYLHLAAAPELARRLAERRVTAIAYETVEAPDGSLPLLAPMSEVAGRLATQIGATLLQKDRGGPGILLGGVPGVRHGRATVLGGGSVGQHAARVALGMGAEVTLIDVDLRRLAAIDEHFQGRIETLMSNRANVEAAAVDADLLVGAVLVAGARAPVLVTEETVRRMRPGSVIVDVAVDQGGCVATTRPTTHAEPTYRAPRGDPLRGDEHAGARAAHLHLRADERDAPPRAAARRRGRRRRSRPTRASRKG